MSLKKLAASPQVDLRNSHGAAALDGEEAPRVRFEEVFSGEFLPLMREFARLIQREAAFHKNIVLVARKAVCLYRAMVKNGEIQEDPSWSVVSSRALGYGGIDFRDKNVLVIDDVMIHGNSVKCVLEHLKCLGARSNVVVASLCIGIIDDFPGILSLTSTVKTPFELGERQVLRLAREMVCYVQASGISNNVDQPIFRTSTSNPRVTTRLHELDWQLNNTDLQLRYGIKSRTAVLDPHVLSDLLDEGELDNAGIPLIVWTFE